MKKLIMFVMVLAIAAPAVALVHPADAPSFAGCRNSGQVLWEFIDDGCMPTTDVQGVEPYYYDPELGAPTFGSRHWDDPDDDAGWGGSYGSDLWEWSDGVMTVPTYAEDSFNQPVPERGEHLYLRQYFEVVHTMPEEPDPQGSFIGLGLEIWDMSVYQPEEGGWTGCPVGYEGLAGDGYLEGFEFPPPTTQYELGGGWWKSIWIKDFAVDDSLDTEYVYNADEVRQTFGDLYEATHAVCIIAMDMPSSFQLEEVYLNFIWFSDPQGRTESEGGDIPDEACYIIIIPQDPAVTVETVGFPIHEPQDIGGPPLPYPGADTGTLKVKLSWRPGDPGYPNFTAKVVVDPDPNHEHVGSADFSFTNPVPPDPNGNVTLTFTQADWDIFQEITVKATKDLLPEGPEGFKPELTVTIDIDDPNFGGPDYDPDEPVTRKAGIQVIDNDIPFISIQQVDPCAPLMGTLSENSPGGQACVNVTLSHQPTDDVWVLVVRESEFELLTESMSIMEPNYLVASDPNRMHFTSGNYNINQVICLTALDDDDRPDSEDEWIPGTVLFTGYSDDLRYCVDWLTNQNGFPLEQDSDGELDEFIINFNVQDNECGAWGFDPLDFNEDCVVGLADFAQFYDQWTLCTEPYDPCDVCDKLWNLFEEE